MTREEIIAMAREAGMSVYTLSPVGGDWIARINIEQIKRFAALVAAREREECAKVLDEMAEEAEQDMEPSGVIAYYRSKAAAIRARGNHV